MIMGKLFMRKLIAVVALLAVSVLPASALAEEVTPPDVLSQLLLAVPMTLLYELGLLIARFYIPKPAADEADEAKDPDSQATSS